ncbi:DUF503 domain-containing protein [Numidum massiliense]|uniref:DUF503 domain-containing protein n=1 Tax=Numidum massiliense TaxID=1522315 RepID=UPI0006D57D61|nr:DUF503 domain-containing protein [Numidum massiliense]
MIVGTLECTCRLPAATSLKDKRRVIKSVIERLRARHNVAIAEVADQDVIQLATIGIATVANERRRVEQQLQHALNVLDAAHELEVVAVEQWLG